MSFRINLFSMLLVASFVTNVSCMAGESEFAYDHKRITEMRESKETDKFDDLAKDIQSKWSRSDKSTYGNLMVHTLKSWVSVCKRTNEKIPTDRIQEYASIVLATYDPAKIDNISIATELELVSVLYEKYSYSKGKQSDQDWEQVRHKGHEKWLHAWLRLEKAIDRDWDINDAPEENVPLPEGVSGFPGMSPELIKDSLLRLQYEKAIRENQEKIRIRNEQIKLRNLKKRYFRIIEKFMVSMYSIEPFNTEELAQYLNDYKLNEETKARIIGTVTKNSEKGGAEKE